LRLLCEANGGARRKLKRLLKLPSRPGRRSNLKAAITREAVLRGPVRRNRCSVEAEKEQQQSSEAWCGVRCNERIGREKEVESAPSGASMTEEVSDG